MQRHRLDMVVALVGAATLVTACGNDPDSTPATAAPVTSASAEGSVTAAAPATTAGAEAPPTTPPGQEPGSTTPMSAGTATEQVVVELAAWQTMEIVDVDGVAFTLADYGGTPILVETFATWCVNCRAQLVDTQEVAAALGADAAIVALSVETDLSPGDVADYADDNGFGDIRFAVMSPELLAAFADAFGTTVANPPSTPKVIVDATGRAGELSTGPSSADDLVAELRAAAA